MECFLFFFTRARPSDFPLKNCVPQLHVEQKSCSEMCRTIHRLTLFSVLGKHACKKQCVKEELYLVLLLISCETGGVKCEDKENATIWKSANERKNECFSFDPKFKKKNHAYVHLLTVWSCKDGAEVLSVLRGVFLQS